MDTILSTQAELNAEKAENLKAFSGFKLLHIKREITTILGMIGRNGIFDEYTIHDISHINSMLESLNWIIPEKTRNVMSHTDWLLTVLSVYFHDLGMLVTKREYEERSNSDFHNFCQTVLFGGDKGKDYETRVEENYPDISNRERFLYQEFVRYNHAHRIKLWITGEADTKLGVSSDVLKAVQELLSKLDTKFKRDLALVCESHHLDDLNNTKKYYTSQPYGNSDAETANIQYSAILLRTADLLHITSDRTPSIAFRVINPSDPISQREWAKQASVQRVRPQAPTIDEDKPDIIKIQDTIEVHALFNDAEDFFGLTSYLTYADNQLRKSSDWASTSQRTERVKHEFPWRHIDTSHIEAVGFLPSAFSFELDQARVLDLLTGHTLYNDTGVVLRELVQNSMDAIRLQDFIKRDFNQKTDGEISIHWDSNKRTLTVRDNGTGMTQDIVEKHLLRAGSSRYRDPEFQKIYPSFSAISRFGIGVLSCFMIADDVEITTFHEDEEQGRLLSLRSVHGKYLIRLLNKDNSDASRILGPHGTEVRLRLRPSAELEEIVSITNRWVVVPNCSVRIQIDNNSPIQVGHSSPKEALKAVLLKLGYNASLENEIQQIDESVGNRTVKVIERTIGATTLSYAVEWSPYFKEWDFLSISNRIDEIEDDYEDYDGQNYSIGTCIEGIRIDTDTPGYEGDGIAAIANATGPNAPKTNVARSNIEATAEQEDMLKAVYSIYVSHVENEVNALQKERDFSPTWAAQEGRHLAAPLIHPYMADSRALKPAILMNAISKLPLLIGEKSGNRHEVSPLMVQTESRVWTVESAFLKSAEELIKEVNTKVSIRSLLSNLGVNNIIPADDMMLSSLSSDDVFFKTALEGKEISEILVDKAQRSANFLWTSNASSKKWASFPAEVYRDNTNVVRQFDSYSNHNRTGIGFFDVLVAKEEVKFEGLEQEIGVKSKERILLNYNSDLSTYLRNLFTITTSDSREKQAFALVAFNIIIESLRGYSYENTEEEVFSQIARTNPHRPASSEARILLDIIKKTEIKLFDPWAWSRH
jgi:molecular chaperone HtpG